MTTKRNEEALESVFRFYSHLASDMLLHGRAYAVFELQEDGQVRFERIAPEEAEK